MTLQGYADRGAETVTSSNVGPRARWHQDVNRLIPVREKKAEQPAKFGLGRWETVTQVVDEVREVEILRERLHVRLSAGSSIAGVVRRDVRIIDEYEPEPDVRFAVRRDRTELVEDLDPNRWPREPLSRRERGVSSTADDAHASTIRIVTREANSGFGR